MQRVAAGTPFTARRVPSGERASTSARRRSRQRVVARRRAGCAQCGRSRLSHCSARRVHRPTHVCDGLDGHRRTTSQIGEKFVSSSPSGRFTFIVATSDGWHIELHAGGAGAESTSRVASVACVEASARPASGRATVTRRRELGDSSNHGRLEEHHYRRSEQRWSDAGKPTADVALWSASRVLHIAINVHRSDHTFAAANAVNAYDNEFPDINGDGLRCILEPERIRRVDFGP